VADMGITPDMAAQQIRFALTRLRSRNAHHQFEDACRHFAVARISRNILPATGPVSAGGDQGRDFETFRSYIGSHLPGSFMAVEHQQPVVFACTLQQAGLEAKIREDVAAIAAGEPTEAVFAFCEADMPVSRRHELTAWASGEHGIALQVIDGTALAELLAHADVFWIAERYLSVPSVFRPAPASVLLPSDQDLALCLRDPRSVPLPEWPEAWSEAEYIAFVAATDSRFTNMDRIFIRTHEIRTGVQACDLLGPGDELIHLRRVSSSASFAHLCHQGTASAQLLMSHPSAVRAFAEQVALVGAGRHLDESFRPRKVILAFPNRRSSHLNLTDIPVLSRASLVTHLHAMNALAVTVEVVGITPAR
jgi:Family of unknown function (DUF6119)